MNEKRYVALMALLGLFVLATFTISVGAGAVSIAPAQVVAVFLSKVGVSTTVEVSSLQANVLWSIRVPRAIMALTVGGALAVSGTTLQGVFRNPLAEPSLLGISGGAVAAAMIATVIRARVGIAAGVAWVGPLAGFVGALVVSIGLYAFFRKSPRRDVTSFLLIGVIANVILGALITLLPSVFRNSGLGSDATFWTMGGLSGTLWPAIYIAVPVSIAATLLLWRMAPQLNLIALGDTDAQYLGVDTDAVRWQSIVLVSLLVGSAVAVAGVIAFIGLVVPHALRLIIGPDHLRLIPASALGGAFMVTVADLLAKTAIQPSELPVGVLTTLVGGPLFVWLFYRERVKGRWV